MARINEKERQDNEDSFSLSSEGSEVLDSDEDVQEQVLNVMLHKSDEQILQDHLLLNAMDLFMFLNTNNDQYLSKEEINSLLTYAQDQELDVLAFEKVLRKLQRGRAVNQITFDEFVHIIQELQIDHTYASNQMYNQKFGGISRKLCFPCKNCICRKIRKSMIHTNLIAHKISHAHAGEDTKKQRQMIKNSTNGLMLVSKLYSSIRRIMEKVINTILLIELYPFSIQEENALKGSFKIVMAWLFISIMATVLISYSSQLNIYLDRGYYQPQKLQGNCCANRFPKMLFLTFIGSAYCVLLEALFILETLVSIFGLIGCRNGLEFFEAKFTIFYQHYMGGITSQQTKDFYDQRVLAQLMFLSLPDLIMKVLIMTKVLDLEGFAEQQLVNILLSLLLSVINIISNVYTIHSEAVALQENSLTYSLLCMKARQGWVPFANKIQDKQLRRAVDYSHLKCRMPYVTDKTGVYSVISYQFNDSTLQQLSEDILQAENYIKTKQTNINKIITLQSDDRRLTIKRQLTSAISALKQESQISNDQNMWSGAKSNSLQFQAHDPNQIANESGKLLKSDLEFSAPHSPVDRPSGLARYEEQKARRASDPGASPWQRRLTQMYKRDTNYVNRIGIGKSLNFVSINMVIHLVDQVSDETSFRLELDGVDWGTLLQNARDTALIPQDAQVPYTRKTLKDVNLLKACIDNEGEQKWLLEGAFGYLLADGCDPNVIVEETNQPLVVYTMKQNKKRSLQILRESKNKLKWGKLLQNIHQHAIFQKYSACKENDQTRGFGYQVPEEQSNIELREHQEEKFYIARSKNGESWLQICIDNEPEQDVARSILATAGKISPKLKSLWLQKLNTLPPIEEGRKAHNDRDYDVLDNYIEELKQMSQKHRQLLESMDGKPSQPPFAGKDGTFRPVKLFSGGQDVRSQLIEVLKAETPQSSPQGEWFLQELMQELILDGCDINIAVNQIPICLYASLSGKVRSLNIMLDKGLDWKRFISNCKADRTIKKSEGSIFYSIKDSEGVNWLKLIVDQEPVAVKQEDVQRSFFLGGLMKALLEDGCDPNVRVIIEKNVSSCSLIKYAQTQGKLQSFKMLKEFGSEYFPEEIEANARDSPDPRIGSHFLTAANFYKPQPSGLSPEKQSEHLSDQESSNSDDEGEPEEIVAECTRADLSQYDFEEEKKWQAVEAQKNQDADSIIIPTPLAEPADGKQQRQRQILIKPLVTNNCSIEKVKSQETFNVFDFVFELMAFLDQITDLLFLYMIYHSEHNAWFTMSLYSMIAPFFVSYVPYLSYQLEKITLDEMRNRSGQLWRKTIMSIALTPLILVYFSVIDVINQINGIVIFPILKILTILTCGLVRTDLTNKWLDQMFIKLFRMTLLEVRGFRRLRLISQLHFESMVQILLQLNMLRWAKQNNMDSIYGITLDTILVSLLAAVLHFILEFVSLKLEAGACQTRLMHYSIICYNGRLGWVPFIEKFESAQSIDNLLQQNAQIILDYDQMVSKLFNQYTFKVDYEFTNDTALKLIKALRNLAKDAKTEERIFMKIGQSFDNVDLDKLIDLLKETYGRVNLDISGVNTQQVILRSFDGVFDQEAIQQLIVGLESIPLCVQQPKRKIKIQLNSTILEKQNQINENLFATLMKEAHLKADIEFKDVDISNFFQEQTIIDIHEDISPDEIATKWLHILQQLSNQEDMENLSNILKNFPCKNWSEESLEEQIDQISFHFVCTIIDDNNEMVIYNLYQIPGLLERLNYKKQLCLYMHKSLNIDLFVKFAKYDSSLDDYHINLLAQPTRKENFCRWVRDILSQQSPLFILYQEQINRYFRYKVSQLQQPTLEEQLKQLNEEHMIRYATQSSDLIPYDLTNTELIQIEGHHEGKNKREVVQQILNSNTDANAKWLVKPIQEGEVKGWVHIKFKTPIYVRGFGLRSGHNFPARDPHSFELLAKIDGVELNEKKKIKYGGIDISGFTRLHSEESMLFDGRWETRKFQLYHKCSFVQEIKLLITSLRFHHEKGPDVQPDWMQIGQFVLFI